MHHIKFIDTLDSTNDYLKSYIERSINVPNYYTVCAHEQTNGHGQQNSVWIAEKGRSLTFSQYVFFDDFFVKNIFYISMAISIALYKCIEAYCPDIWIKWPNDLYIRGRKVAGILIESNLLTNKVTQIIFGVGLNCNQKKIPKQIPNATSLFLETNREYDLKHLLYKVLDHLKITFGILATDNYRLLKKEYLKGLFGKDQIRFFKVGGEKKRGIIKGIDLGGALVVKFDDGIKKFKNKEIEFL